jgi:diguanylate cyclase (GGDEF)-like protein/PAS domain S-box-containing protein
VLVLASYAPLLWGLLALPSAPRDRGHRRRFALDLATAMLGAGLALWCLVVRPAAADPSAGLLAEVARFDTALLDFGVVAVVVALLLGRLDAGSRLSLRLLAAGQLLSIGAGVVTAVLGRTAPTTPGHWVDGLWMASAALLVLAAHVQFRRAGGGAAGAPADVADGGFGLVPYAGVALGYGLLLYVSRPWWGQSLGVAVFGGVALSALVVVRQVGALRDNRRLVGERLAQEAYFRGLIEHASDIVYVVDGAGRLHYKSPSAARALGYPAAHGEGLAIVDFVHPADRPAAAAAVAAAAAGERSVVELRVRHADGSWRVIEAAVGPLPGPEPRLVLNVHDVTGRVADAAALRESRRALETLLRNLPGMAYRCRNDAGWSMEFVSDASTALTGYPATDFLAVDGRPPRVRFGDCIHPDDRARVWDAVQEAVAERRPYQLHFRITTADGETRHLWEQGRGVHGPDGALAALEGFVMDVTERTAAERERERLVAQRDAERALLDAVLEQMPAAVVIAEAPSGRLLVGNGRVDAMFGGALSAEGTFVDPAALVGFHPDGRPVAPAEWPLARAVRGEQVHGHELRVPSAGGEDAWVRVSAGPVRDRDGRIVAGVAVAEDVTERKRLESRLEHQAFHDPLTGLANRLLFRDRTAQALARSQRDGTRPAVLFLDLDGFKTVNDSLGHAEGDRLIVEVAHRLLNATRGCDTVARLGGDEFAVLLAATADGDEARLVADRVLRTLARPVALAGREVLVGASLGIATAAPGDGAGELLRNADLAMYRAKARGKGTCEVFAPEMYEAAQERVALEADLRRALARGEFRLAYQPIVDLASGQIVGAEALVRWHHPERGVVPPTRFVGVAEESGLVLPLGRLVLADACAEAAAWHAAGHDTLYVAVNISGRQLEHPRFVADVADALDAAGLAPAALLLEITEGAVMHDTEASLARLAELKALGVRLAVDDFGTGYSSLSYLQRFPIDVLKIDKSFVDGVHEGGSSEALARTIVALGRTLALCTVAEGVERAEQRDALRALGCTLGQGYLFARPMPAEALGALVTAPTAAPAAA